MLLSTIPLTIAINAWPQKEEKIHFVNVFNTIINCIFSIKTNKYEQYDQKDIYVSITLEVIFTYVRLFYHLTMIITQLPISCQSREILIVI